MSTKITHSCCPNFDRAKQSGTDNEGYAPLLWIDSGIDGDPGRIKIGSDLPPINFCPWCRAPIDRPDEVAAALRREFGYLPDERDGENWTVYQNHTLIVCHPERRPRFYKRGCGGTYYEIDPIP